MSGRAIAVAVALVLAVAAPGSAQYFGRNKVRYARLDFRVLQTPHFDIYYYPAEEAAVQHAARMAERWYGRLSKALAHEFSERQPIVLYASHTHFGQNTIVPGFLGDGVGGVTEHLRGRVVLPFAAGLGATDHVLGHELVHAFQRDVLRSRNRSIGLLPLWFVEGMAEYLTVGRLDANTAMWLRDAARHEQLPDITALDDPRYFPYRYGQALWAYLAGRFGDDVVAKALASTAAGGALGRVAAVTGTAIDALSVDWHRHIREHLEAAGASDAADADQAAAPLRRSTPVIAPGRHGGRLNLAPALSPDGTQLVFLSERDGYSVDVYLADATSGAVIRRLVQMAADPHFDSLQFIASAGAWAPVGRRFAMAGVRDGQPVISLLDVDRGDTEREYVLDSVDAAYSPSWAPDGTRLVFSGMRAGFSDLYVLDLDSGQVEPLTSDGFADLQPAWSPDGRTIAFATDRFSSSLDTLSFGPPGLAALDVASRAVRPLPSVAGDRNVGAQWSADGRSLYFVADADHHSQVYRLDVGAGAIHQVTALDRDVSGVTALSPVLSVAAAARRLAFTAYRRGSYEVHVVDAQGGAPFDGRRAPAAAPVDPAAAATAATSAGLGLPDAAFEVKRYNGRLSLHRVGQPYLSMGGGSVGSFMRAGISFSFGDMLDQHSLRTAVQVGKALPDLGVQVAYLNRRSRWNWGVVGEQVGAVLGVNRSTRDRSESGTQVSTQDLRLTRIHRRVSGVAVYPFSLSKRLELSAGVHTASFGQRATTTVRAAATGALLDETIDDTATQSLAVFDTGAALVHDSAATGPTSPILGTRYRLAVSPTLGQLRLLTTVADYRRYVMPVRPFTIAWRARHVARWGDGGADPRLAPLVFDLRDTARGYSRTTLGARTCPAAVTAGCTVAALLGTRHVLTNTVELRAPLAGMFSRRPRYGPLPLEGFVFSDSAWLWIQRSAGEALRPVRLDSAGAGVRIGAAGFVFELAAARRLQGPDRGWGVAVNLRPGF